MRTGVPVLMAAILAACSSGQQGLRTPASPPPAVIESGTGAEVRLARDDRADETHVTASVDSVFARTRALYRALGLPVQAENRRDGIVESGNFRAPRELFDQPLARLLDCGQSLAGARVTLWNVTMQLTTGMRPHPENGTLVATRITASARPRDGTSTPPVPCYSTGRLERELAGRIGPRAGS